MTERTEADLIRWAGVAALLLGPKQYAVLPRELVPVADRLYGKDGLPDVPGARWAINSRANGKGRRIPYMLEGED